MATSNNRPIGIGFDSNNKPTSLVELSSITITSFSATTVSAANWAGLDIGDLASVSSEPGDASDGQALIYKQSTGKWIASALQGPTFTVGVTAPSVSTTALSSATIVIGKGSNSGIKVDISAPTYSWADLIGPVIPKATGVGSPSRTLYFSSGVIYDYSFALNDEADFSFHLPHDYALGTDTFIHVHWSHNGTDITGTAIFSFFATYSKGHNQAIFSNQIANDVSYATVNLATTPRYKHRIEEIQLSNAGGGASALDTNNIETDGLIIGKVKLTSLPTVTGGALFIHTVDIHYQSTNIGTKQKAPDFYT